MKPTKKQLVIGGVAVVVVLAVVLWIFIRKASKKSEVEKIQDENDKITPSVEPAKRNLDANGVVLVSQNLLNAMNRYGTDEQSIIENLKLCTKDDLLAVIKEFGVKPYNGSGLATRWEELKFFSDDLNLSGWIKREVGGSKLKEIQEIFKNLNVPF